MKLLERLKVPIDALLAPDQSASIERVANDSQATDKVINWLKENSAASQRSLVIFGIALVTAIPGLVLVYLPVLSGEPIGSGFYPVIIISYLAYFVGVVWAIRYPGRLKHRLNRSLLRAMRSCELAAANPSLINRVTTASCLSQAQKRFYACWSRERKIHAPASYKRELRRVARAGEDALGSYIPLTVLCDGARFCDIRDDIARVLIRMAVGRWDQVSALGVREELTERVRWVDRVGASLSHNAATGFTAVIVVPVLGLLTLIVPLLAKP